MKSHVVILRARWQRRWLKKSHTVPGGRESTPADDSRPRRSVARGGRLFSCLRYSLMWLVSGAVTLTLLPVPGMAAPGDGWISLFNGRNLDGWTMGPDRSWIVEDGVITLKREQYDGKEHNSDYLWTVEQYGDFILELDFKIPERANSGIYLRTPDRMNPVFTGIEVQVANSFGRTNLSHTGTAGAIYDCLAPSKNPIKKPGEWNRYRITCDKNTIRVVLNDEPIIDMDLDQWREPNKNPDGSKNKFGTALKDFARRGHLGFQDHGRPVWYRNIRIKKLSP